MIGDPAPVDIGEGITLDVLDCGPRDAPALIFLHGFPESHRTWRHQIAHLQGQFRCIAPDQRGYRGSSKPVGVEHYAPAKMIGDVFRLADRLGIERFTVLGHDWGGAVAWGVAMTGQGSRVTRAVIANAPHPAIFPKLLWTDPEQRRASQYFRAFRDPAIDAELAEHGLAPLLARTLGGSGGASAEDAERAALIAGWADPAAALAMISWYRASPVFVPPMDAPFGLPADYRPLPVPRLTIPTLVIWGMDDHALGPANLDGLDAWIDDPVIARIPDCGHFVTWQAPDAVNAALGAFLAQG